MRNVAFHVINGVGCGSTVVVIEKHFLISVLIGDK
uniref:Uncharacterized protein n=1 Tax=Rhizophora mucronata TaxID=61149 RepID=A0A2P2R1W1_RHIMU